MVDFLVSIAERQKTELKSVAEQVELSMSEVLRRILDDGMQGKRLNDLFPAMSGRIELGK